MWTFLYSTRKISKCKVSFSGITNFLNVFFTYFLRFKYKDEYEKFKLILSGIGFVMAILNYCVRFRALELSYIFLLVWYYCTLTIRESILKLNGSRIKGWWRFHHFFSTGAAGILLIWPDNETWLAFRNQFVLFNIYLSMFLKQWILLGEL